MRARTERSQKEDSEALLQQPGQMAHSHGLGLVLRLCRVPPSSEQFRPQSRPPSPLPAVEGTVYRISI